MAIMASMFLSGMPMASAAPTPTAVGTVSIGGITWTDDIRVTRNGASDTAPQITVDANHDAHIMWQSARSPAGYYYVKLNRLAEFLSQETYIPAKVLAGWGSAYPLGPTIDIDSQNNLHVVYDDGWENVKYMKLDEQGNVLVPEKNVGPMDGIASHTPSVAVGTDDTVHIAHEEYKFQCEDITYSKLANDGSDIWLDRVVSSDVASHCEFSLIKTDKYNGNIMFTFGSASGTWLGRFNKFGVKDMASVKLRSQTDYLIADVAATPDGVIHTVWQDGGHIRYTRVNGTGVKVLDAVDLTPNAQSPGFPRIAATSDNKAVVVWEDSRAGNKEIYFAIITPDLVGTGGAFQPPENIRLTTAGADSTAPWIAIDADNNFHVAWVDNRDGNNEIYYKFAFNFALELLADPIDVANMLFIHPNETKVLPMLLKNKGGLDDGYNLNLNYTPGADSLGWRVTIDRSYVDVLGSMETIPVNLTVKAPAQGKKGDTISVSVNASSISASTAFDRIDLNIFIQVTRAVKLNVDSTVKNGNNGDTVAFNMLVSNTGDVREDSIRLEHILGTGPGDWVVTLDKSSVALDPKASTNFTVWVSIPENAPGLVPALFGITAFSSVDSTARDSKQLTVSVRAAFIIQMSANPPQRTVDPGATAVYDLSITNIGNLPSQVQINVQAQNPTLPGFTAALDRETLYLRGGDQTSLQLTVGVPANAVADTRLTLVVSGLSPAYGTEGRVDVTTFVNRVQGLDFQLGSALPGRVGRPVSYELEVQNNGNGDETLQFAPGLNPERWNIEFLDGPATITNLFIPHGQSKKIQVRTTIGTDALAGNHVLTVSALDEFGNAHIVPVSVGVVQFFAVEMTTPEFKRQGSPGSTIEYSLTVTNNGNGPDNFTLSTDGLSAAYGQARFFTVSHDLGGNEFRQPVEGAVAIGAHGSQELKMLISVPIDAKESTVQFSARASSQGQEQDAALLQIDIRKADLRPGTVTLTPSAPNIGQITAITVEVQNTGDIDAQPVIVAFYDNGQLIGTEELVRVASQSKGYVTFAWLPTAGEHSLRFVIDPVSGPGDLIGKVVESDETNNVGQPAKDPIGVGTSTTLPGFDSVLVLAAIGSLLVASRLRRKDE
jgi:uncharacterized membrane protein